MNNRDDFDNFLNQLRNNESFIPNRDRFVSDYNRRNSFGNLNNQPGCGSNQARNREISMSDRDKLLSYYSRRDNSDNFVNQPGSSSSSFGQEGMNKGDNFANFANQPRNSETFIPDKDTFVSRSLKKIIAANINNQPESSNNALGQNKRDEEDFMAKRGRFNDNDQEFPRNQNRGQFQ